MRARFLFVCFTVLLSLVSAFSLLGNVYAPNPPCNPGSPPTCYLEADTTVPSSDATVYVRLDNSTFFTLPHTFAFVNGTRHSLEVMNTTLRVPSTGVRYFWNQWNYGGYQYTPQTMLQTPLMVVNYTGPNAFQAQFTRVPPSGCFSNCNLEADTTVAAADGTVKVRVDSSTIYSLPYTFSFANGTIHTIQVLNNSFTGASSGAMYVWKQWTHGTTHYSSATLTTPQMIYNYTTGASGSFVAEFDKEYQLTLSFTDPSNNPIGPASSVTLSSGTDTVTLTSFSSQWVGAKIWTVSDIKWQGVAGLQVSSQTIDLTGGALSRAVKVNALSATVKTVDRSGNPVSGVIVTVTLLNSTAKSFTTDSQGLIDLGPVPQGIYTAHVVYNGSDVGNWSVDASSTPTLTVIVAAAGGGGALGTSTTTTAVAVLAILGVVALLLFLAFHVRKKPVPPKI
jgi:hypothetical protein